MSLFPLLAPSRVRLLAPQARAALILTGLFSGLLGGLAGMGCSSVDRSQNTQKKLSKTERSRALIEIANGALLEGDPTGALQQLERAELEDPLLPELHHSKALAFHAKHQLKLALTSAQKAIQIEPSYPEGNNTLGKILLDLGQYDEAIVPLRKAAENSLYRDAFKAWTNLGILKYRQGFFAEAEDYFNLAIQESPLAACIAYYYRGHLKLKKRLFLEAIASYAEATKKFCAQFGDAKVALGLAYQQSGQYGLARQTFVEIQKLYPHTRYADQAMDKLRRLPP